jgi:hypothetical protein
MGHRAKEELMRHGAMRYNFMLIAKLRDKFQKTGTQSRHISSGATIVYAGDGIWNEHGLEITGMKLAQGNEDPMT